jgi:hypothetical protein
MGMNGEHRTEKSATGWITGNWHQASHCASNGCVEARAIDGEVTVRSSRDPDGPSVRYGRDEWNTFIAAVKAGEFDLD